MKDEKQLVQKLKKGKEEAFRMLINEHKEMVYRTAYGFLRNKAEAEDVAQEVFVEVFNSINKFKGDSRLSTWLYRITSNKAINQINKNQRRSNTKQIGTFYQNENSEIVEISEEEKYSPEAISENQEKEKILHSAINTLPENQKTAFVLHKIDGVSYKEIKNIMKLSTSSVESLIHRAKTNLQKKLINYYQS